MLLLDEPFGALDAKVRQELRQWLRRLHDEIHMTSVFVTHDQEEAFEVADQVVVMNDGRDRAGRDAARRCSSIRPTPFVMDFLGNVNVFHGRVHDGRAYVDQVQLALDDHHDLHDAPALVYARPHEIEIVQEPNGDGGIAAVVRRVLPFGAVVRVELESSDGALIEAEITRERYLSRRMHPGESVFVRPQNPRVFVNGDVGQ